MSPGFDPYVRMVTRRRKWQTLQCPCLENPMDRGAWQAVSHEVAKSCQATNTSHCHKYLTSYSHQPYDVGQFSSVTHACPALCDWIYWSMPGIPVHHQLPELAQTHVHRVSDAIQPSHPPSSPSPPAFNLSQHQGLFQ